MKKPNGLTIKAIREAKGISKRELSRRVRVSSGYFTRLERGDFNPREDKIAAIAAGLEVPVEAIADES